LVGERQRDPVGDLRRAFDETDGFGYKECSVEPVARGSSHRPDVTAFLFHVRFGGLSPGEANENSPQFQLRANGMK
jgi:hypothetical protein